MTDCETLYIKARNNQQQNLLADIKRIEKGTRIYQNLIYAPPIDGDHQESFFDVRQKLFNRHSFPG